MKTEIEINENLIPEGYEAVRFGKEVKPGEIYLDGDSPSIHNDTYVWTPHWPVLILKKKRWRADVGETYWFTTSFNTETMEMEVDSGIECGDEADEILWKLGSYFKTKAEAVEAGVRVHKAFLNE